MEGLAMVSGTPRTPYSLRCGEAGDPLAMFCAECDSASVALLETSVDAAGLVELVFRCDRGHIFAIAFVPDGDGTVTRLRVS